MKKAPVSVLSLVEDIGGDEGDRTPDLMNAIHALSQLSYVPVFSNSCAFRRKINIPAEPQIRNL